MELIVLKGDGNVGKTETINIVYQLMLSNGYTQVAGYLEDLGKDDFVDVLYNGSQKIGIVSQGDYAIGTYSVKNHLIRLQNAGCDKAICACTNGKPKIINAINGYIHTIINKTKEPDASLQEIENKKSAQKIISYL